MTSLRDQALGNCSCLTDLLMILDAQRAKMCVREECLGWKGKSNFNRQKQARGQRKIVWDTECGRLTHQWLIPSGFLSFRTSCSREVNIDMSTRLYLHAVNSPKTFWNQFNKRFEKNFSLVVTDIWQLKYVAHAIHECQLNNLDTTIILLHKTKNKEWH